MKQKEIDKMVELKQRGFNNKEISKIMFTSETIVSKYIKDKFAGVRNNIKKRRTIEKEEVGKMKTNREKEIEKINKELRRQKEKQEKEWEEERKREIKYQVETYPYAFK